MADVGLCVVHVYHHITVQFCIVRIVHADRILHVGGVVDVPQQYHHGKALIRIPNHFRFCNLLMIPHPQKEKEKKATVDGHEFQGTALG